MLFSTEDHGFSLNQLYRRSFEIDHDLPSLIIIKDVKQNVTRRKRNNSFLYVYFSGFWGICTSSINDE